LFPLFLPNVTNIRQDVDLYALCWDGYHKGIFFLISRNAGWLGALKEYFVGSEIMQF